MPAEAVDNYRRILEIVGDVAAETIAPNAEDVDREGNTLNDDGTVTYHPKVRENLRRLAQADLMGFTLPYKYGGLNCPNLIYTMATEMVSRADGSLMNIFGLQGIAETINAFASEEIKDEFLPRFANGEVTGAMVLTEPDAGSDLQAVRLRADLDENGDVAAERRQTIHHQRLRRGAADAGPQRTAHHRRPRAEPVHLGAVRAHQGAAPGAQAGHPRLADLRTGLRQRAGPAGRRAAARADHLRLALMNGARLGIAAQGLGIAEAAYRLARLYAHTRQQFGVPIEKLPAVAEMVTDMQIRSQAARALTYETSRVCDHENNNLRVLEAKPLAR